MPHRRLLAYAAAITMVTAAALPVAAQDERPHGEPAATPNPVPLEAPAGDGTAVRLTTELGDVVIGADQLCEWSRRPEITDLAVWPRPPDFRTAETPHRDNDGRGQSSIQHIPAAVVDHVYERRSDTRQGAQPLDKPLAPIRLQRVARLQHRIADLEILYRDASTLGVGKTQSRGGDDRAGHHAGQWHQQ